MENFLYISLFSPLIATLFSSIFAFFKPQKFIAYINSTLIFISFISALFLFSEIYESNIATRVILFDWINIGNLNIAFSFMLDHISIIMLLVVTFVSTAVHFYSISYMKNDQGFNRFFCFFNDSSCFSR